MSLTEIANDQAAGEESPKSPMKLQHNDLDGFQFGGNFDMRVRFAMQLLTSPMFQGRTLVSSGKTPSKGVVQVVTADPQYEGSATLALDIASELFDVAEQRGLITEITGDELDERIKSHFRRVVAAQLYQQHEGQRQQEARVKLASAVASTLRKQ